MLNSPEVVDIKASYVVLTAGAWSGQLGRLLGIGTGPEVENLHVPIPVEPRKRYVYVVHCPDGPGLDCPLLIDTSGSYMRREGFGGNFLSGRSPPVSMTQSLLNFFCSAQPNEVEFISCGEFYICGMRDEGGGRTERS